MNLKFKQLSTRQDVDLIPYLQNFLEEHPDSIIYVGCDSHNVSQYSRYGVVIVLHEPNKGGHVLYTKINVPKITDRFTRLWNEIEYSLSVAEYLKEMGVRKIDYIDLDLNPDPKYKSNQVLRAALGYVESMGYAVRVKPEATIASTVADAICK